MTFIAHVMIRMIEPDGVKRIMFDQVDCVQDCIAIITVETSVLRLLELPAPKDAVLLQ